MSPSAHDAAPLSDLKLQLIWLCVGDVLLGTAAVAAGW